MANELDQVLSYTSTGNNKDGIWLYMKDLRSLISQLPIYNEVVFDDVSKNWSFRIGARLVKLVWGGIPGDTTGHLYIMKLDDVTTLYSVSYLSSYSSPTPQVVPAKAVFNSKTGIVYLDKNPPAFSFAWTINDAGDIWVVQTSKYPKLYSPNSDSACEASVYGPSDVRTADNKLLVIPAYPLTQSGVLLTNGAALPNLYWTTKQDGSSFIRHLNNYFRLGVNSLLHIP